jgi:hypothetical protein
MACCRHFLHSLNALYTLANIVLKKSLLIITCSNEFSKTVNVPLDSTIAIIHAILAVNENSIVSKLLQTLNCMFSTLLLLSKTFIFITLRRFSPDSGSEK